MSSTDFEAAIAAKLKIVVAQKDSALDDLENALIRYVGELKEAFDTAMFEAEKEHDQAREKTKQRFEKAITHWQDVLVEAREQGHREREAIEDAIETT